MNPKCVLLAYCSMIGLGWAQTSNSPPPSPFGQYKVAGGGQGGLVLRSGWDNPLEINKVMGGEFLQLLKPHAPAGRDVSPAPDVEIYPGIKYLDKLSQASQTMGRGKKLSMITKVRCLTPGFPVASMAYHDFAGSFDEGFGHVLFITDVGDQVVAIQFLDNTPKSVWLTGHTPTWSTFNFIQTRRKAVPDYKIAHKITATEKVIRLDSELIDAKYKSRERVRLFIPKKFASIVVAVIEAFGH